MEFETKEEAKKHSFMIVARAHNGVIGKDNNIPWKSKADMQHFAMMTMGCIMIIGRKTYDSLPVKLTGRYIVVVSSSGQIEGGPPVAPSVEEAVELGFKTYGLRPIAFAGGSGIYKEASSLPWMTNVFVTHIILKVEGDTFFQHLDPSWRLTKTWDLKSLDHEPPAIVGHYKK